MIKDFQQALADITELRPGGIAPDDRDLESLQLGVTQELAALLFAGLPQMTRVSDLQPPTTVVVHMARAAAEVLIAFERGYRLGG